MEQVKKTPENGMASLPLGLCELMSARIAHFSKQGRQKTADNYACALRHFQLFINGEDVALADVSVSEMKDFQQYLISKGLKMNTVSLYNRVLRAAYHYALDAEIISMDKRPFRKSFTGREKTRKRAVESDIIKRLTKLRLSSNSWLSFSRDLFLFSIYMQGMPFVDMAHLRKEQVKNGWVLYQRRKTNRQLRVKIQPEAQAIIDRYHSDTSLSPYVFPIVYDHSNQKIREYMSALRVYNRHLSLLSTQLGLDEPLSSYVARHTWASLARQCGVSDTVICEAMGHSHVGITTIYLASLDTGLVARANKHVIAFLTKQQPPEDNMDFIETRI